jgi:hypothetical protein
MKLTMTFALALVAGVLLASCGGSSVGDDVGDALQPDLVCTAQCEGKECGMDGCGGICGGCEGDLVCDASGHCVEPCVAKCTGKACGDDGCGSTCGTCPTGQTCSATGQCEGGCVPSCGGKTCGPDGCNGTCGTCGNGQTCSAAGQCEGGCVPSCGGKECGPDGCNGSCGACANGETCSAAGLCGGGCVPNCAGKVCGPDGCNGSCGACGNGQTCTMLGQCDGACLPECTGKECGPDGCNGECGVCAEGEACTAGQCTTGAGGCQGVGYEGCCDGDTIKWCEDDTLNEVPCAEAYEAGQAEGPACGWVAGEGYYWCVADATADPSGAFPRECGACTPDCTGKECGSDGCGGTCGACAAGETCSAGQCTTGGGEWTCDPDYYDDGTFCDCACGDHDPDCDQPGAEVFGCDPGQACTNGVCTNGTGDWTCDPEYFDDGVYCDCECGTFDPDCEGSTGEVYGCDPGQTCDAEGHCAGTGTDDCGDLPWEGCCAGDVLTYCEAGELVTVPCAEVGPGAICGWYAGDDTYEPSYNCGPASVLDVTGDPSGEFPLACAGACTPACDGRVCGPDGCGGSCGTCAEGGCNDAGQCVNNCGDVTYEGCCVGATLVFCLAGEVTEMTCTETDPEAICGWYAGSTDYPAGYYCGPTLDANGNPLLDPEGDPSGEWPLTCEGACVPACDGKECGPDGCGGTCGGCATGETCTAGQCVGACVPACDGKECGPDGCGGSCGACAVGETCTAGTCVSPCSENGFTPEGDAAAYAADAQLLVYAAYQAANPADYLSVELWQRYGGPIEPGSYVITDEGYETCVTCVLIAADCDATGCQKLFLANAGGLTVTALGVVGDSFAGELTDVKLVEVDLDPDTYVSTPVPNGQTWCLDTLTFDAPIDAWPEN